MLILFYSVSIISTFLTKLEKVMSDLYEFLIVYVTIKKRNSLK